MDKFQVMLRRGDPDLSFHKLRDDSKDEADGLPRFGSSRLPEIAERPRFQANCRFVPPRKGAGRIISVITFLDIGSCEDSSHCACVTPLLGKFEIRSTKSETNDPCFTNPFV
jgi:hypothetical protein